MTPAMSPYSGLCADARPRDRQIFAVLDEALERCRHGERPCDCTAAVGRLGRLLRERFGHDARQAWGRSDTANDPRARTRRSILAYVARLGCCLERWDTRQARQHLRCLDRLLAVHLGDEALRPPRPGSGRATTTIPIGGDRP